MAPGIRPDTGTKVPDTGVKVPNRGAKVPDRGAKVPDSTGVKVPDTGAKVPDRGAKLEFLKWRLRRFQRQITAFIFRSIDVRTIC